MEGLSTKGRGREETNQRQGEWHQTREGEKEHGNIGRGTRERERGEGMRRKIGEKKWVRRET